MIAAVTGAFYLGILCSISPCPLATNIAAVGFIGRKSGHKKAVIITGICYVVGRILTYILLGLLLTTVINSTPQASHILQKYMNIALGPLLIMVGMILLEMIKLPLSNKLTLTCNIENIAAKAGYWGAFLLGVIFALSFCPTSAALFFGALLPLAIKNDLTLILPGIFGVASGLPVIIFAFILAGSIGVVGRIYNRITRIEQYLHYLTGLLFLALGVYFTITQTLKI